MNIDNTHGRKQTASQSVYPLRVLPDDATNADVASVPPGTVFVRGTQLVKSGSSEFTFPTIPTYSLAVVTGASVPEPIFYNSSDEKIYFIVGRDTDGTILDTVSFAEV